MELLFHDVVASLHKIKLPENFLKRHSFYVKITARNTEREAKMQVFKKERNQDFLACSRKMVSLVTSILFKNKVKNVCSI